MNDFDTQVVVIGGGPGGATTAGLLARHGFDVVLLERHSFPRYQIGESLLPSCLKIFDALGVREKAERYGFQRKHGARYDWGGDIWDVSFGTKLKPQHAWQVVRSEFDRMLLNHAVEQGADVREGATVTDIAFDGDRPRSVRFVEGEGVEGTGLFDFVVDASGREGLLATQHFRNRRFHEAFQNIALWGYWRGAGRLADGPLGATASCSIPCGWIWAIPLHDGTLSVGVVMHKSHLRRLHEEQTLAQIYDDAVRENALVEQLISPGRLVGELRTEADYSYAADRFAGAGHFLVGDAACFLDPLLSTGIHLATFSGMAAAASIASILRGEISETEAQDFFNVSYRRAYLRMLVVVSSFYQLHTGRDVSFRRAQELTTRDYDPGDLREAFVSVISSMEDLDDIHVGRSQDLLESLVRYYSQHYEFMRGWHRGDAFTLVDAKKGFARMRVVMDAEAEFSLTPETAVNGLYLDTGSSFGLKQVAVAPSG